MSSYLNPFGTRDGLWGVRVGWWLCLSAEYYRIAQVQLSNIIRHAKAKNVTIRLKKTNNLELSIADDGIGFLPGKKTSGIGLRNIRNRVEFYNGDVIIVSEPGRGCTLTVTIPLRPVSG